MKKLEDLLDMWKEDSVIDRTEPSRELIKIPTLHSKYLTILSHNKLLSKETEFKYKKLKRTKWEYYSGKMDEQTLDKLGWDPFPYILKSDIAMYLESDKDLNNILAQKILYDEIVDACNLILKELSARTYQLRDFISWERFIQGI